jgi:hypothetical protein
MENAAAQLTKNERQLTMGNVSHQHAGRTRKPR